LWQLRDGGKIKNQKDVAGLLALALPGHRPTIFLMKQAQSFPIRQP